MFQFHNRISHYSSPEVSFPYSGKKRQAIAVQLACFHSSSLYDQYGQRPASPLDQSTSRDHVRETRDAHTERDQSAEMQNGLKTYITDICIYCGVEQRRNIGNTLRSMKVKPLNVTLKRNISYKNMNQIERNKPSIHQNIKP